MALHPDLQKYGYSDFHKNEEFRVTDKAIKHSKIVGKMFKVIEVTPFFKYGAQRYKIKLEDVEKNVYYYDYNLIREYDYKLSVEGGLILPEGVYCSDIEIIKDKFTDKTTFKTPYTEGVRLVKVTERGTSFIALQINEIGHTLNVGEKGLYLVLKNWKKISKPNENIDVAVNKTGEGYMYTAFAVLTDEDIALLSESPINDNRLFVYDGTIKYGNKIMEYIKCLAKK